MSQEGNQAGAPLKTDGRGKGDRQGPGEGKEEEKSSSAEREEEREGRRRRGREGGSGGGERRPRFEQIGAGSGGRRPARPAPESWDLPPTVPGTASPTGRAGQGRAGRAPGHVDGPRVEGPHSPAGGRAGSSGGLGGSRATQKSPGPACLPLPHLLGRLSVTRGGRGGPGGGRLLIGPDSARPEGRAQGRAARFRGRKHAQRGLPTPSLRIPRPAPRPPEVHLARAGPSGDSPPMRPTRPDGPCPPGRPLQGMGGGGSTWVPGLGWGSSWAGKPSLLSPSIRNC